MLPSWRCFRPKRGQLVGLGNTFGHGLTDHVDTVKAAYQEDYCENQQQQKQSHGGNGARRDDQPSFSVVIARVAGVADASPIPCGAHGAV